MSILAHYLRFTPIRDGTAMNVRRANFFGRDGLHIKQREPHWWRNKRDLQVNRHNDGKPHHRIV